MTLRKQHQKPAKMFPGPIPPQLRRGGVYAVSAVATVRPKSAPVQHAGYMAAVRQLPCAHCGAVGPSQFCHSDEGKGTGIKSDCRYGWPGCATCHDLIGTRRIYQRDERRALEARMAAQTRVKIEALGLWPKTLPRLD